MVTAVGVVNCLSEHGFIAVDEDHMGSHSTSVHYLGSGISDNSSDSGWWYTAVRSGRRRYVRTVVALIEADVVSIVSF